ncbi:type II toxin-antitoxin system RelB family antitoxin [Streptococcus oricebi]|uniref:Translation repressor RelB n=1 Tax=Streptococcus oricebi TaxID=1547447 RepID=A0ABS5B2I6_9STRE|nr:DUF6290 family protein [Streptococcus oricebi]MBP2623017.1 translation repressor RelB [Streptococcus oricebi]
MATISLRLNQQEEEFFRGYAGLTGKTLSELFKTALAEQIENELDLKLYHEALAEHEADPQTVSFDDFKKELGL